MTFRLRSGVSRGLRSGRWMGLLPLGLAGDELGLQEFDTLPGHLEKVFDLEGKTRKVIPDLQGSGDSRYTTQKKESQEGPDPHSAQAPRTVLNRCLNRLTRRRPYVFNFRWERRDLFRERLVVR